MATSAEYTLHSAQGDETERLSSNTCGKLMESLMSLRGYLNYKFTFTFVCVDYMHDTLLSLLQCLWDTDGMRV